MVFKLDFLPIPLEKYDGFFRQLAKGFDSWNPNIPETFRSHLLAILLAATRAQHAFIARHAVGKWEAVAENDVATEKVNELLRQDGSLRELLLLAIRHADENRTIDPNRHPNVTIALLPATAKVCLLAAFPRTTPPEVLVVYGMNAEFEPDVAIASALNTLLEITNNLKEAPLSLDQIESAIYDGLKRQFGYVSDYVYKRQFELFTRRLRTTTVVFEPVLSLDNPPDIDGWEALARYKSNGKTPEDLFRIAELWGPQFRLELDMYFLETAINRYIYTPRRDRKPSRMQDQMPAPIRVSDIKKLSVNVYPDSLIRRKYREKIKEIAREGHMPLNRLVLEISEKFPLPTPESPKDQKDPIGWFRQHLMYYTARSIKIAIDDFGVGHASSSRLSRLSPEVVKIDRDVLLDNYGTFIFEYVIRQALHGQGKQQVIVEGHDTDSKFTLGQLYKLGVRYIQGHTLGKAVDSIGRLDEDTAAHIRQVVKDAQAEEDEAFSAQAGRS